MQADGLSEELWQRELVMELKRPGKVATPRLMGESWWERRKCRGRRMKGPDGTYNISLHLTPEVWF